MSYTPSNGQNQRLGCMTALLLMCCSLVVSALLTLFVGSMAAELMGARGFYVLFLLGFAISLGPALIFNGFLTWARTRMQKKEAWFGDTPSGQGLS